MHYYSFNIGDYARDTGHLTVIEHGIYRLLLDWCYLNEKPITTEQAIRVGRGYPEETQSVLSEFFSQSLEGWTQHRIGLEVEKYHGKARANRENGAKGGRPKPKNNPVGSQSDAKHNPNQEPRTNNQEPITNIERKQNTARGSRLPENFDVDFQFAVDLGIQNTLEEANKFRDYWKSQPGQKGVKLDWQATWRNWCRNAAQRMPMNRQPTETFKERDARQARARWEEMTGQTHPDNLPKNIIEVINPQILELSHDQSH